MTWFRRLVIGTTEFFLVVYILLVTILSGIGGAALGSVYLTELNATSMQIGNSHPVAVGTVVGSILYQVSLIRTRAPTGVVRWT
jgi:hypothetical protein